MLRFGPDDGPVVVMALPLLEEANRVRAFVVAILRALAERGVAGALPDLPGTGESLTPLESMTVLRIQEGYEGAVSRLLGEGRVAYGAGIRSGALLDALGLLAGRWYLSPQTGPELLRELTRIKQAQLGGGPLRELWYFNADLPDDAPDPPVEVSGHLISPALLTDLLVKEPFSSEYGIPLRTVRLATDPGGADLKLPGTPLWRRAEPGNDPVLAQMLADDIAQWVRACKGC